MVDGINTYGAGTTVAGVVQDATPPKKREGGAATDDTKPDSEEIKKVQTEAIKNLLNTEATETSDFVSQAEVILNKALSLKSDKTKLSIDVDESGLFVYRSVDKSSGEVISQFPAEEILALLAFYREAEGIVVDESV